jgi:hypothetical protein
MPRGRVYAQRIVGFFEALRRLRGVPLASEPDMRSGVKTLPWPAFALVAVLWFGGWSLYGFLVTP